MRWSTFQFRNYRVGFFFVVILLTGVAVLLLITESGLRGKTDRLVAASLEREQLIAVLRLDVALLERAVDDHINATDDAVRLSADNAIRENLDEIATAREKYAALVPDYERDLWNKFTFSIQTLVSRATATVKHSSRREAEVARRKLVDELRPLGEEIDDLAEHIGRENSNETRRVLSDLGELRFRTRIFGAALIFFAVIISIMVARQVLGVLQQQQQTIGEQLEQLAARNAELDAFASRVAHDLVSPLATTRGYLTLSRRSNDPQESKEMIAQAESGVQRVSELVDALLKFCRAGESSGPSRADFGTAVSTVLLEQAQAAQAAKVELIRHIEHDVFVGCPSQLLQSIARNLISNAIKYSAGADHARVDVQLRKVDNRAILTIQDNGRGMSDATLKSLFQPFFRGPNSKNIPGHGLGLSTTKRLIDAHRGHLTITSSESSGTLAFVEFTLATPADGPLSSEIDISQSGASS